MNRFVSVDWGTSRLRVRLVDRADGVVLASVESEKGAAVLAAGVGAEGRVRRFESALTEALAELGMEAEAGIPIVASGMVSSSIGWRELGYAETPFSLGGSDLKAETLAFGRKNAPIHLLSGVRSQADVMRGEETEALGLWQWLEDRPVSGDPVMIFPGTHSKHLSVAGRSVVSITTFMTGELYALLRDHSVLRHSLGEDGAGFDEAAFRFGLEKAGLAPLSAAIFQTRSLGLLGGLPAGAAPSFLSGILIGAEVHSLPCDRPIVLAGAAALRKRYAVALESLGFPEVIAVPDEVADRLAVRGQLVWLRRQSR